MDKTCIVCDTVISFKTKTGFGSGKLNDGNEACNKCYKKIIKLIDKPTFSLKKFSTDDIMKLMKAEDKKDEAEDSNLNLIDNIQEKLKGEFSLDDIKDELKKGIIFNPDSSWKSGGKVSRKLTLYDDRVVIELKKTGSAAEMANLFGAEDTTEINFVDITSANFREGGGIHVAGVIEFVGLGMTKQRTTSVLPGVMFGGKTNPYAVYFGEVDNAKFKVAKTLIDMLKRQSKKPSQVIVEKQDSDIPAQIKKLSDLKDQGILSDEEFEAKKKDLLDKM